MRDHHANPAGAPERHHNEAPAHRIEAVRDHKIEGLIEGNVEGDAGDFHGAEEPNLQSRKACG